MLRSFWCIIKNKTLFDGSLEVYPDKKVHIDLKSEAKLVNHHAYHLLYVHQQTFKKELDHTVELGILEPFCASEWESLAFITPKQDVQVHQITNLHSIKNAIILK